MTTATIEVTETIEKPKKKKSKTSEGKKFEKDFIESVPLSLYSMRFKDDTLKFKGICNEADFLVFSPPFLHLLELKSHLGKSIPFGALQPYQVKMLYEYSQLNDYMKCGFVFNFRELDETFFIEADKIYDFYHKEERKSFSIQWCRDNGTLIPQAKKSNRINSRYRYDLNPILH